MLRSQNTNNKKRRKSLLRNGCGKLPDGSVKSIMTDGVGMSIRSTKYDMDRYNRLVEWDGKGTFDKKEKLTEKELSSKAKQIFDHLVQKGLVRLIAIDPGRDELFHSATMDEQGNYVEHRFKRDKYLIVSLRNRMTEFIKNDKTDEIRQIEGVLARRGGWKARTSEDYAMVFNDWVQDGRAIKCIEHYSKVDYALWKMRLYKRRESVVVQRFKKMIGERYQYVDGKKVPVCVLIGYGSADIGIAKKGEPPVPTKRNAILLRKYLRALNIPSEVIMVWEHLTTQMCHVCQQRMVNVLKDGIRIRGLKLCTSTACCQENNPAFRNRDGNAARNILSCLKAMVEGENRPDYLCPETAKRRARKRPRALAAP